MKKFIMLALVTSFALSGVPAGTAQQAAPESNAQLPTAPLFTLQTETDDPPALARKKAALRLFKSYGATMNQLTACRAKAPEADKAARGFMTRNGNTLATVSAVIKKHGGLTPEIKVVVDAAIAEEVAAGPDCRALIKAVNDGGRDIYKAPPYLDDYNLVRSK